jgi:PAS domain S-box-containing protein
VIELSGDGLAKGWSKALGIEGKQFNMFFEKMMDGFAHHKIILDREGKPVDYVFLEVNSAFERLTGLKRDEIIGKHVTEVIPGIEKDPANWIGVYGRVALTGEPVQFENYAEPLGKWFKVSAYSPEKSHFVALFEDITSSKKAELALRESELKFRTVANFAHDWEYWISPTGSLVYMSPSCKKFTGYSSEEFLKNPNLLNDLVHPDDKALFNSHFELVSSDPPHEFDFRIVSLEGEIHWLAHVCQAVFDDEGKWLGRRVSNREITKRKKAEKALLESEQRWSTTISSIGDAVITTDLNGKVTFLNAVAEDLTGWSLKEASSRPIKDIFRIVNEYNHNKVENPVARVLKKGAIVGLANHTVLIKKNGTEIPIDDSGAPIKDKDGKVTGVVLIFRDITERKKVEEMLKTLNDELEERVQLRTAQVTAERQRLYNVLEALPSYVILLDKDHHVAFANKVFRETFGEDHGRRCHEYLFGKDSECENCETYKVYKENKSQHWYWTGPNGHDYDIYDFPFKEADGSTLILEMGIDITERKKAEATVQQERKRLFDVLETLPAMICLITPDYHIAFANRSFREKFGESHGRHCYDYCFGQSEPCKFCESLVPLKTGKPHHWEVTGSDDSVIEAHDYPFTDVDGKKLVLEMDIDVTARKKAEAQAMESARKLKDAERLAAIGATAGMVGHDIRNPLQAIVGDAFLAKSELETLPESEQKKMALESIEEIGKNTEYINKIVQDLQDFARPLNPKIEEIDLKQIIQGILSKNSLPESIKVSLKISEDARKINADAYYLNRILSNLITNSVQAMPEYGKLTIKSNKKEKDITISVTDNGVGIPDKIKGKMFSIMFTTKSKGQGFGLPVVKRMTESLGGTISFESQQGKGTTFTIRLPLIQERN